jgi:NAD(P)-dependent dehydrogenase (short-subunit alcohol dehydrogenase family)
MSIHESLRPIPDLRVLVTAGAGGGGAVVARTFHEAGARVHVCDVDRAALDRLTSGTRGITGSMADASVAADVELVFDDVKSALGGLDVLINNAGISGPAGPIEGISAAGWERTVAVNLNSQYHFAHGAVPLLRQSSRGASVIALASGAVCAGCARQGPCAATQWAIVGLVKSLAIELGPQGVRVNAILPGVVDGERMRRVSAEDMAALALFLCSPAARHVTGQAISLNGQLDCL